VVKVSANDHLLQLFLLDILSEILGDAPEVLDADVTCTKS